MSLNGIAQTCLSPSLPPSLLASAGTLQQLISDTMVRWAQESVIEDPELVRAMFVLLHRQYDGIGGQVRPLYNTAPFKCEPSLDMIQTLAKRTQQLCVCPIQTNKKNPTESNITKT